MKFFGNGIVFHPFMNQILAEFKNGEFETFEEDKIKELLRLGYESDLEEKEEEKEVIKAKNKKIGGKK